MEQQESDAPGLAGFLVIASVICLGILGGSLSCEHRRATPPTKGQSVGEPNATIPPAVSLSASAKQGKQLFDTIGCRGCHVVHSEGGNLGPNLSDEGARDRSREWLRTQIRDPKANNLQSQMFPFDYLSDQQVNDLVDYLESLTPTSEKSGAPSAPSPSLSLSASAKQGKQLFTNVGCLGCHMVNGQGGKVGPDLSNIANAGHSRQWLKTQIQNPKSHDPQTAMPAFNKLSDQQVSDLVDYMETLSTKSLPSDTSTPSSPSPSSSLSASAKQGRQLFGKVGCLGCHMVNGQGGNIGPNLSNIANAGHSRQWLKTQIQNPKSHDPQTAMPAFNKLSDQQVNDLVDYMETLSTTSKPSQESGQQRGKKLFETIGCRECHTVNGQGGKVGPDLSNEGNKGHSRQWFEIQIRNPRAHDPNTAMPAWDNLPRRQMDDLIDYLESLKGGQEKP
jgi:sulfur oxidation c-type cytochrome SoxX